MRYSTAVQRDPASLTSQDGVQYTIERGSVAGVCHIQEFLDEDRGVSRNRGYLRFTWAFASEDRGWHVYLCILHPYSLWADGDAIVRSAEGDLIPEASSKGVVLDTRDCPPFRFADGSTIQSAHKYNDLAFQMRAEEAYLRVRLRFYIGDLMSGNQEAYMTVDYEKPWERLLWRKAAVITDDDVSPESAEYVDIRRIGTLDDPGVPPGLRVSPITWSPQSR